MKNMLFYFFFYSLVFCFFIYPMDELSDSFDDFPAPEEFPTNFTSKFPLHDAVLQGNIEKIKECLYDNCDITMRNESHETPLHVTRFIDDEKLRYSIMNILLEHKADPNSEYYSYMDTAHWSTQFLKSVLLNHCIKKDYVKEVNLLLSYKANPNPYCSLHEAVGYSYTPLQLKSTELVELLLEYKADVNQKNKFGDAPLLQCIKRELSFFLCEKGILKCKTLLKYGANIGLQDNDGNTLFHQENFWDYFGEECFKEAHAIIKTLFIIKRIQESCMQQKIPKPLMFSIIKLADPGYTIFLNPALNTILGKKNKENKTAYDLLLERYAFIEKLSNGDLFQDHYTQKKMHLEKIMPYLKPQKK